MNRLLARRAFAIFVLGLVLVFAIQGTALAAGYWSYVKSNSSNAIDVWGDLRTPSQFTGGDTSTTSKAALWVYYSDSWATNFGWLVRFGEYNTPYSFYVIYNQNGTATEQILGQQGWNYTRSYNMLNTGDNDWALSISSFTWAHSKQPVNGAQQVRHGAKTSANNNNIYSYDRNMWYMTDGFPEVHFTSTNSTRITSNPLIFSVVNANYNVDIYNDNYY